MKKNNITFKRNFVSLILVILLLTASDNAQQRFVVLPTNTPQDLQNEILRPKIGLVLSGGGARGLAQIGVLKVFEKQKIPIDFIVGNSLGSVVGGLYASGYSVAEIESIAVHTDWEELLSFKDETKRSELFIGQKQTEEEGYFNIRFEGLEPIIPSSISGGQRILNFFTYLTLQALYHPNPTFDDLKIPFRAVATDLITGERIILDRGSLAEALRASVTVPLLYTPIERDSMFLVDGGLRSNIPVDIARSLGCDIVIVVNSTSSMRKLEQMKAPWEIADQIMTIMMQESNKRQLQLADIVITPQTGERIVSDFTDLDTLISSGERAANESMPKILEKISEWSKTNDTLRCFDAQNISIELKGDSLDKNLYQDIRTSLKTEIIKKENIENCLNKIYETKNYDKAYAEVIQSENKTRIVFNVSKQFVIRKIDFHGNEIVNDDTIKKCMMKCIGQSNLNYVLRDGLEDILKLYRGMGYSLARIESVNVHKNAGVLSFKINEGKITSIKYDGNIKTKDYILRREFPLSVGDVFNIDKASEGIVNIKSTGLFDYAFLDVRYENNQPVVILRVKERSSDLVRLGFHADNEHGLVSTIEARDGNFRGAWEDLGIVMRYGYRDRFARIEYTVNRIFHSYFTFNIKGYFKSRDIFTYEAPATAERWDVVEAGKYREIKYGGNIIFGSHMKRFGDVTMGLRWERHKIDSLSGVGYSPTRYMFASFKLQSTIDTEDKFSFPTSGLFVQLSFESAAKSLSSQVGFGKIEAVYENYITFITHHTLRSRVTFGFADNTLPLAEQFSLGGLNSFIGLREDYSRGRQLFLVNFEYRFGFPFKIIFDTYLKLRYDFGTISLVPEELKFSNFHHGVGVELALDTPIGPASIAAGKSFFIQKGLPNSPLSLGPILFYFSIGPRL